jgi:hypothetical protein
MNTYAWDYIFSDGDTIKEKFGRLYHNISGMCVRKLDAKMPAIVSCCREISDGLACYASVDARDEKHFVPQYKKMDDGRILTAEIKNDCGGHGYHADFELYEDPKLKNKILIKIGNCTKNIEIFNYPFEEEQEAIDRTITVRLQGSLFRLLELKCKERYKTISEVVRELVIEYVNPKQTN